MLLMPLLIENSSAAEIIEIKLHWLMELLTWKSDSEPHKHLALLFDRCLVFRMKMYPTEMKQ